MNYVISSSKLHYVEIYNGIAQFPCDGTAFLSYSIHSVDSWIMTAGVTLCVLLRVLSGGR